MFKILLCLIVISASCFADTFAKPTTIYFTRHGKTHWNAKKLWQGTTDTNLNLEGIRQAQEKAEYFQNFSIDAIYTSPLKRALLTAQIIASVYDKEATPSFGLLEPYLGKLEGMHADDVHRLVSKSLKAKSQEERRNCGYLPGLISDAQIAKCVENELVKIALAHPGQNILVIGHSTLIQALMSMHTDAMHDTIEMSNMAYLTLSFDGEVLKLRDYSPDIKFSSYPKSATKKSY